MLQERQNRVTWRQLGAGLAYQQNIQLGKTYNLHDAFCRFVASCAAANSRNLAGEFAVERGEGDASSGGGSVRAGDLHVVKKAFHGLYLVRDAGDITAGFEVAETAFVVSDFVESLSDCIVLRIVEGEVAVDHGDLVANLGQFAGATAVLEGQLRVLA
jgi:hypothetical protein